MKFLILFGGNFGSSAYFCVLVIYAYRQVNKMNISEKIRRVSQSKIVVVNWH